MQGERNQALDRINLLDMELTAVRSNAMDLQGALQKEQGRVSELEGVVAARDRVRGGRRGGSGLLCALRGCKVQQELRLVGCWHANLLRAESATASSTGRCAPSAFLLTPLCCVPSPLPCPPPPTPNSHCRPTPIAALHPLHPLHSTPSNHRSCRT